MASLPNDLRQLFSHGVLSRFDRLEEADVAFTYSSTDVYVTCFSEAMESLEGRDPAVADYELLRYAKVFERFLQDPHGPIEALRSGFICAALYWIAGFSANGLVIARHLLERAEDLTDIEHDLLRILSNREQAAPDETLEYLRRGDVGALQRRRERASAQGERALARGETRDFVSATLLKAVLDCLEPRSFWSYVERFSSASWEDWVRYANAVAPLGGVPAELWPSQRLAIEQGLLDGDSTLVLRTPTSSGKTKLTELTFVNDLFTDPAARCLYLAPFRALVSEVETSLGGCLARVGFSVATLYGGSEANAFEARLNETARVVIATPEKMAAVLNYVGSSLSAFHTIVVDEGHLLDSRARGAAFELQLARLRPHLQEAHRAIFLSAVLPNSEEISGWLAGDPEALVQDSWQPAAFRIGIVTWPDDRPARLTYVTGSGEPLLDKFFVPRILEEDAWRERHPETNRFRTHRFPERTNSGSIAAALAFKAVTDGPVIIFAARRDWANAVAARIIDRIELQRPLDTHLVDDANAAELERLSEYIGAILGADSVYARAVASGFAIHHGAVPQHVRLVVEQAYRNQVIRLLIATNTIAQGVNFPAKTVIVHSFPMTDTPIRDFWNLVGRAGRALHETEGEVLILATGSVRSKTLRRFLDNSQVEPAESTILALVRSILERYPSVSSEALEELLQDDEDVHVRNVVTAVDSDLLRHTLEDVALEELDIVQLAQQSLAHYQACLADLRTGSDLEGGVESLFEVRRTSLVGRIEEPSRRRWFGRSGLSVDAAELVEAGLAELRERLQNDAQLNPESLVPVAYLLCTTPELAHLEAEQLPSILFVWISTGSYPATLEAHTDLFSDLEDAVQFIDSEVAFRVPWILTGLLRLIEDEESEWEEQGMLEAESLPPWLWDLPDYLRYGVNSPPLVWVSSLGLPGRPFAEWLLDYYRDSHAGPPGELGDVVEWLVANRDAILEASREDWPSYFPDALGDVIQRYEHLRELLRHQE